MTNPPPNAGYSRFHAIVAANPGASIPARPASSQALPYTVQTPTHVLHQSVQNGKRRRVSGDSEPSEVLKDAMKSETVASRQRPEKYPSKELLLDALKLAFRSGPHVDFHGSYDVVDPGISHKQRVQSLTIDIWRATGYRFTVKDHPHINNGHKTRFWCSQDDAHRSKSSKLARLPNSTSKPRISSAGEALAKARYACKSRLLISSRDTSLPGQRTITIRIHHHIAHEPYVDTSLPPELAQAVYETFGWINTMGNPTLAEGSTTSASGGGASRSSIAILPEDLSYPESEHEGEMDDEDGDAEADDDDEEEEDIGVVLQPPQSANGPVGSWTSTLNGLINGDVGTSANSGVDGDMAATDQLDPQRYHQRMRAHINNIREFCDGLEYQLQFNDYRMLDVLEREGVSFLRLVQECLRKEGRLDPAGSMG